MTETMIAGQGGSSVLVAGLAPAGFRGSPCTADPDLFFDETPAAEAAAKAVCADCPFRAPCLLWAMTARLPHGVAGGLTADERRLVRRRESRRQHRTCPRCGGEAPAGRIYCGDGCRDAARADARARQNEMRAAARRRNDQRRRTALHTVAVA